jgi:hypothetical protein
VAAQVRRAVLTRLDATVPVTMTFATQATIGYTLNWLCSMRNAAVSSRVLRNTLVLVVNDAADAVCRSAIGAMAGACVNVRYEPQGSAGADAATGQFMYGTDSYFDLMRFRTAMMGYVLSLHREVVFSDSDLVFLRDCPWTSNSPQTPRPFVTPRTHPRSEPVSIDFTNNLRHNCDEHVRLYEQGLVKKPFCDVCGGLLRMTRNRATLRVLRIVLSMQVLAHGLSDCKPKNCLNDQWDLNYLIQHDLVNTSFVTLGPQDGIYSGTAYYDVEGGRERTGETGAVLRRAGHIGAPPCAVHSNFVMSSDKMATMRLNHLWFLARGAEAYTPPSSSSSSSGASAAALRSAAAAVVCNATAYAHWAK